MSSQLQVTGEAKIRDIQGPVVANSGVITALNGAANQYVRGDGTLASFPTSGGGGSSVSYYLNGSVNQGTFGGSTYYQMSKNAIVGSGTNFSTSANGLIAQFITDANDPDVVSIPSGNWNVEFFMSVSASSGSLASFYVEIYKYNGSTFTLLATNVATPEQLTNTTTVDAYFTSVAMPLSSMAITDRLAIRVFANVASKTVTLYTEDNRLCQVVTTFSKGMLSMNNLTDQSQYLTTGTAGTNFAIASSGDTHTFNLPVASATNTGKLSSTDWTTFNNKLSTATAAATYVPYIGATSNVDLGTYSIGANTFLALGNGTSGGAISFTQTGTLAGISTGVASIGSVTAGQLSFYYGNNLFASILSNTSLTADRTFTLPDLSGTLALLEGFQTFTGVKTFDEGLSLKSGAYPTPATGYSSIGGNSFGITVITKQSSTIYTSDLGFPATNRTFTFPNLDGTIALLEGTQTFSGRKYFSIAPIAEQGIILNAGITSFAAGQTTLNGNANGLTIGLGVTVGSTTTNYAHQLLFPQITPRTYTYPAESGTIALTSNLSSYVPYTGATTNVDLGSNSFTTNGIITGNVLIAAPSSGTSSGVLYLKQGNTSVTSEGNVTLLSNVSYTLRINSMVSSIPKSIAFNFSGVTASTLRTFTLPDASGTLALTSNLSAYLPLTGGTLTGALNGTSATFSGQLNALANLYVSSAAPTLLWTNAAQSTIYGYIQYSGGTMNFNTGATAATFSSSVYASARVSGITQNSIEQFNAGGLTAFSNGNLLKYIQIGYDNTGNFGWIQSLEQGTAYRNLILNGAGGNVGIGATPLEKFWINLATNVNFAVGGTTRTRLLGVVNANDNFCDISLEGNNVLFHAGGPERMRITSGGQLLVNKTTSLNSTRFVDVAGNFYSSGSSAGYFWEDRSNSANFYGWYTTGNTIFLFNGTANAAQIIPSTGVYTPLSDINKKKDFELSKIGLDAILGLKPTLYRMKSDESEGNKELGFIAQEVKEFIPQAYVESGEDENKFIGLNYNAIVAALVKSVQELKQELDELKNK